MTNQYYIDQSNFLVVVDCIIFGFKDKELSVLLTRRPIEPLAGEWSLMGGFVSEGESLDDAAKKVLFEYTQQRGLYMEQVNAYGAVNRDSGGRVISIAFYALVRLEEFDTSLAQSFDEQWINVKELPQLVFDHNKMVEDALTLLRLKVAMQPIIFQFFDEKFTLPALQDLYEAIYQREVDKRNFRRKLLSMNILDRLDLKDTLSSKKGAFYYELNEDRYKELLDNGSYFSL